VRDPNAACPEPVSAATGPRRNLVFARVGQASVHPYWLAEPAAERNWDLQLSTWIPDIAGLTDGDFPVHVDPGVKWGCIGRFFAEHPELLDRYDYVLFPDDDLLFDAGSISRIFTICREHDLKIAQPALRLSSYAFHCLLFECPAFRLRYTNFVEPMAPVISTEHLRTLLPYFGRWQTGWGLDHFWTLMMRDPRWAAAIIDCEPMLHIRPLQTGGIYTSFRRLGLDPLRDMAEIQANFTNVPQGKIVCGSVLRDGRRLGRTGTNLLGGLHLLRVASAAREPERVRRAGLGMIARIVTKVGYRPTTATFRSGGDLQVHDALHSRIHPLS
jgi:hypothetical protein